MLQKTAARALIVAALSLAALPSCGSDFGNCGLVAVATLPTDSVTIAVGDSVAILAELASACPDKISSAVTFSTSTPTVIQLRTVSDSSAWAKGLTAGTGQVTATGVTRTNVRSSVQVNVR